MTRSAVVVSLITGQLEELRRRKIEIEGRARQEREKYHRDFNQVRQLVQHGKASTGDPITDYFLAAHGSLDSEDAEPFRAIERKMKGKSGQLFLVIRKKKVIAKSGVVRGEPLVSDGEPDSGYVLGVLTGEQLVLKPYVKNFGLPADRFTNVVAGRLPEVQGGPFMFGFREMINVTKRVHARYDMKLLIDVVVGDPEALRYVPGKCTGEKSRLMWTESLYLAARALGKDVARISEQSA